MAMLRKLALSVAVIAAAGGVAFWWLTEPERLDVATVAGMADGDATRGEQVFWAGGCASCHAASGATEDARLSLGGGLRLETAFGTFVAPNISQSPEDGIGMWTAEDLANAMMRGVSPGGSHYYPAFPYTSYARMEPSDIADLSAFMKTLPAVEGAAPDHELSFPFNIRRALGLWKLLYLNDAPAVVLDNPGEQVARGQYLVEGPAHCGECHTPRDALGGLDLEQWMAGATAAEGDGNVPNITASDDGLADWSEVDIVNLLETGFTPDYDSVGGSMASVVRNMAELPASDREAIAAYLKAIPPHPNGY